MLTQIVMSTAAGAAEAGGGSAMPQFDPATFSPQLFWLAIAFLVLYFIMSRLALPRVSDILRPREERIADDLDRAERLNRDAEDALATYEQALADARTRAHEIAAETRARLQADTEAKQADAEARLAEQAEAAEARIKASRDEAMSNVQEIAADAASAVVAQLLGTTPDTAAVQGAVDSELSRRGIR